jgi:hypothetical protein
VLTLRGVRHHFDDVREHRIGPIPVDRAVQVSAAPEIGASQIRVSRVYPDKVANTLIDAEAHAPGRCELHVVAEEIAVDGEDRADVAWIGILGVDDVQLLLTKAVDAQDLLVGVRHHPVVEDAGARPQ